MHSRVRLFATPWTVALQAPLSRGFARQKYQSGLPFPSPGDVPNPGVELRSLALQAYSLPLSHPGSPNLMCVLPQFKNCTKHIKIVRLLLTEIWCLLKFYA